MVGLWGFDLILWSVSTVCVYHSLIWVELCWFLAVLPVIIMENPSKYYYLFASIYDGMLECQWLVTVKSCFRNVRISRRRHCFIFGFVPSFDLVPIHEGGGSVGKLSFFISVVSKGWSKIMSFSLCFPVPNLLTIKFTVSSSAAPFFPHPWGRFNFLSLPYSFRFNFEVLWFEMSSLLCFCLLFIFVVSLFCHSN